MKFKILTFVATFLFAALSAFSQGGGKAEPLRINFEKGKSAKTVIGTLKIDQEYEYVFGATAGQTVSLKLISTSPKGKFHAFRVLGADEIDFVSEFDINYDLKFTAPETGDYLIFVSMRPTEKVKSGKFSMTLGIQNQPAGEPKVLR